MKNIFFVIIMALCTQGVFGQCEAEQKNLDNAILLEQNASEKYNDSVTTYFEFQQQVFLLEDTMIQSGDHPFIVFIYETYKGALDKYWDDVVKPNFAYWDKKKAVVRAFRIDLEACREANNIL